MRVESYEPGDKIHYKTGRPSLYGIPRDREAAIVSTKPRGNVLSVQLDGARKKILYNPGQLRTQTRESRTYQEETREIAQGSDVDQRQQRLSLGGATSAAQRPKPARNLHRDAGRQCAGD